MTLQAYATDTVQGSHTSGINPASDTQLYSQVTGVATASIISSGGRNRIQITNDTSANIYQLGTRLFTDVDQYIRVYVSDPSVKVGLVSRCTSSSKYYNVDLSNGLFEIKKNGSTTIVSTTSATVAANTYYWIHFRIRGFGNAGSNPNNVMANFWADSSNGTSTSPSGEPAGWQIQGADSGLTAPGGFGLYYKATSTAFYAYFDAYTCTDNPAPDTTPAYTVTTDSPYGVTYFVNPTNQPNISPQLVSDLAGIGNGAVARWQLQWADYEPIQGLYDWGRLDDAVQLCNYNGVRLHLAFQGPPSFRQTLDAYGNNATLTSAYTTSNSYTSLNITALNNGAYIPHGYQITIGQGLATAETVFVWNPSSTYQSGATSIGISTSKTSQVAWTPANNHAIGEYVMQPAIFASASDYSTIATLVATRYNGSNGFGKIDFYQAENENYDIKNRIGNQGSYNNGSSSPSSWDKSSTWDNGGAILAPVYIAIRAAIRAAGSTAPLFSCAVRKTPNTAEQHIKNWLTGFVSSVIAAGGVIDGVDFHYYRDGTTNYDGTLLQDPTTNTYVSSGGAINCPSIGQEIADIKAVLSANGAPSAKIMCGECGWDIYDDGNGVQATTTAIINAGTPLTSIPVSSTWVKSSSIPNGTALYVDYKNTGVTEIVYAYGSISANATSLPITTNNLGNGATQTAWTPATTHAASITVYAATTVPNPVTTSQQATYIQSMLEAMRTGGGSYCFVYTDDPINNTVNQNVNPNKVTATKSITMTIGGVYTNEPAYNTIVSESLSYPTWSVSATPFSVYGSSVAATTLTSAGQLATATGGTDASTTTKIGTATGWGEITAFGSTTAWPALGSMGSPSGKGWLLDTSLLSGQTLVAGNITPQFHCRVTNNTIVATFVLKLWAYDTVALTYTLIDTVTLSNQTINSTSTLYSFPTTSLASFNFGTHQRLYIALWMDIITNSTGASGATFNIKLSTSGSSGVAGDMEVDFPGYTAQPPALGVSPASLSFVAFVGGSNPASQNSTLTETAGAGTAWTITTNYASGSGWLGVSPSSGSLTSGSPNQTVTFSCTTGSLAVGTYSATVTFVATTGGASTTVTVTFAIQVAPVLASAKSSLTFIGFVGGSNPNSQQHQISETAGSSTAWTSSISYMSGSGWLSISPSSGTLAANGSQQITYSCTTGALINGTYNASITFTATTGGSTVTVNVIFIVIITTGSSQMTYTDLYYQNIRIVNNIIQPDLQVLATTYYGNATNNQVIYGELDALLLNEQISALHVMRTINDVTTFLQTYHYLATVLKDNPVVFYRLLETSGSAVADTIRNMTGIITGSPTLGVSGPLAVNTDTAIQFSGGNQYIQLPAGVNTANWNNLTLEAWIKPSNITFSQTARIIANETPSNTNLGFELAVTNSSVIFAIGNGSGFNSMTQAYSFVAGTWYLLAATFNGTSMNLFINGSQIDVISLSSSLVAQTTNPVYISKSPNSTSNGFPGAIGQVAIYNTALSSTRLLNHYNTAVSP